MPVVVIAGLNVGWKTRDLARDIAAELLGAGEPGSDGKVDLRLDLRPADDTPRPSAEPVYFHGPVQVSKAERAWLVEEGRTRIVVGEDGVRAQVDPDGEYPDMALRVALFTALRAHGVFQLHAGGVQEPDGEGILVCGESGAGKTTFVLSCVRTGCAHLGDDTVLLRRIEDRVVACSFPRPFACTPRTIASLSLAVVAPAHEGKSAVDPGARPLPAFEPRVLLFPVVSSSRETTFSRLSQAEALGNLITGAPLVASTAPGRTENLSMLRELACRPAWRVALGADLLVDPAGTAKRTLAGVR